MKRITTIIFCCVISLFGYSQNNISGTWEGVLDQRYGKYFDKYKITLQIEQVGDQIKGTSYIAVADIYAEMAFEGTYKDDVLVFQENRIIRENIPEDLSWCIKQASLQIEIDNGVFLMVGPWTGNSGISPRESGHISLQKTDPRA